MFVKYSATSEDLPKPDGAEIKVKPVRSMATSARISRLDRKLGGNTGGKVRDNPTPGMTEVGRPRFMRCGATPKGEAFGGEKASRNHPKGVRPAGELKGWRKLPQERQGHPLAIHR